MIGFYDYTVILTYLSLLSAGTGILIALNGDGHPYWGMTFLLFCGLLDAFDGRVARTKKNRTDTEKNFGIQIDSLTDLVAFGVLPMCIGAALIRRSELLTKTANPVLWALSGVMLVYLLAAMIRLAYFNVTEEERQKTEKGARKTYIGLPVTSASLIFPTVLLIQHLTHSDITPVYFGVALLTGLLFISRIRIGKPGLRGILIMIGIGAAEFLIVNLTMLINR